ncbi:Xenotropic and polytropic retrovirus receptor 1 [Trichuris trichiura]|uniref:Xenotropic and polytropic retrovirus receptor 1 n=1 Tax=Trichuris trichiura TaxID=36087 RepID=A0A077ZJ59_TRITR|nr:Xenotropic and polytropic retrovirus receptor 1 [Trichuris trichiura]
MKFAEHLATHLTPEWRKQYIDYMLLKVMIYEILENAPDQEVSDQLHLRYMHKRDGEFFALCAEELKKINLFYKRKLAEAQERFTELARELERLQSSRGRVELKKTAMPHSVVPSLFSFARTTFLVSEDQSYPRSLKDLRDAFCEFYLSLILLQNYQQLNATGFRKILKKHDKVLQNTAGNEWRQQNVECSPFFLDKEIDRLIELTEHAVTEKLEQGDRQAAMKRLRVLPFSEQQHAWTTFRLGFFMGSFLVLLSLIVLTLVFMPLDSEPRWVAIRLFRGFLILFAQIFLMGVNMYGWQRKGVNHVLIFEIDPRRHLTYQQLLEISTMFLVVWSLCILGYLYADHLAISKLVFPLILMGFCIVWLLNPFCCIARSSRYWLIKHVFNCFTAPFHYVTFPDFWLADQMNSLVTFFLDMEYFVCFYASEVTLVNGTLDMVYSAAAQPTAPNSSSILDESETWAIHRRGQQLDICSSNVYGLRPVIAIIPALIRFLQCLRRYRDSRAAFPHLFNAGKYSTTFFVVIFGTLNTLHKKEYNLSKQRMGSPFFYLWVIANCISFCYTYSWDIRMDWGLFEKNAGENKYLREELVYSQKAYYYGAMVADFFLRITWVLNVSLGDAWLAEADVLISITAPLECIRRFIWNYFRLENEHLNNCGQFRAVRDISLKPITKGDLEEMSRMVDEEDGLTHRGEEFKALVSKKGKSFSKHGTLRKRLAFNPGRRVTGKPNEGNRRLPLWRSLRRTDNCYVDVTGTSSSEKKTSSGSGKENR